MKILLVILLLPILTFGQVLNVKVFRTHGGNGNNSQYPNYANSRADMDKMVSTAYSNTTLWWKGTINTTTCLNWNTWTTISSAGANIPNNGEYFSVEISGIFTPVETGTYIFGVDSDDGADLIINNVLVSTYYGGHGMGGYQLGSINLIAGTPYTFISRIQEYGGGEGLAIAWKRPSQTTYTLQPAELGIYIPPVTISGIVSVPILTSYPTLSLYKVDGSTETLVETKTVATNGTYSFTVPTNNTTYKLYPSLIIQGITLTDFNLIWGEVKNINTPNNIQSGLVITGTKQWKAADINLNGILDLGDAFLAAAHITGLKPINQVLWFTSTNYDIINKTNFSTINPITSFTFNITTSNIIQNIKYCILGDINLSHSSQ